MGYSNFAFVLLSEAEMPNILRLTEELGPFENRSLTDEVTNIATTFITFPDSSQARLVLMPTAVPRGEAGRAVEFSVSSMGTGWDLPVHNAHVMVSLNDPSESSKISGLKRFTSLISAVTKVTEPVGIYWGNAGASHDPAFFVSVAEETGDHSQLMIWTGVSIASKENGELSFLSLGMGQLDLPNLFLKAGNTKPNEALGVFFDLLAYVVNKGSALPEGDTVGRSADEQLVVHYIPSPAGDGESVWSVTLN